MIWAAPLRSQDFCPLFRHTSYVGEKKSTLSRIPGSEHLQSLIFALVFAPIAITLMSASFVSVLAATSVGQPLSSSMGMLGTMVAGGIIGVISYNSATSPAGSAALFVSTLIIGALDHTDYSPTASVIHLTHEDINTALGWSQFRFAMAVIFLGTTFTMFWIHWAAKPRPEQAARILASLSRTQQHLRARSSAATFAVIMVVAVGALYVYAAPQDSLNVAWEGIAGMRLGHPQRTEATIIAGVALAGVAMLCRWTVTGPLVGILTVMIIPTYIVLPLWASLTGLVVTPGASLITAIQMTSPVMMALGTCLLGAIAGPIHLRHILRTRFGANY